MLAWARSANPVYVTVVTVTVTVTVPSSEHRVSRINIGNLLVSSGVRQFEYWRVNRERS